MTNEIEFLLRGLSGSWKGTGKGNYPTIDAFEYDETLFFEYRTDSPLIHYEQRTTLANGEASHWESGFLRWLEDGSIELSNAQDGGRVEVLRGALLAGNRAGEFELDLHSAELGNDPRLVTTRRQIRVFGDSIDYRMEMSTNTTESPRILQHLEARLDRLEHPGYPWGPS